MKLQTILIFLLTSVSLTGQGIMLAGGAVAEEPGYQIPSGAIIHLDANNSASYPGTGTTWSDLTSNGNDFTVNGSPTFNSTGNYFQLAGTGSGDYAISNNTISLSGEMCICAWLQRNQTGRSYFIDHFYSSGNYATLVLGAEDDNGSTGGGAYEARDLYRTSSTSFAELFSDITTPASWFLLCNNVILSSGQYYIQFYIRATDSVSETTTVQGPISTLGGNTYMSIGRLFNSALTAMNISELLVYNKSLSITEINEFYNNTDRY